MKFDWLLLKVIHLDVNSDVNSQPFSMQFCRQHQLLLRQLPCKFGEVWLITAKVINEIGVKFDWVLLKVIHLDVNSDVNSQPFSMQFCRQHQLLLRQLPCKFGEVWLITAKVINEIGVKFDWVLLKVIHLDVNSDVNSQPFSYTQLSVSVTVTHWDFVWHLHISNTSGLCRLLRHRLPTSSQQFINEPPAVR